MRLIFPVVLVLVVAVLVLLVTAIASAALALIIPVLLVIAGAGVIAGLRGIRVGIELVRTGFQLLGHAFAFLGDVLRLIFAPAEPEPELTDSAFPPLVARLSSPQFPEFHQLQQSVAAELGLKAAEELWVSPDAALRVVRREAPAIELALQVVLRRAAEKRRVPARLGESVRRVLAAIPSTERHRLGMLVEGDPLELGGRTHPTIALRIAALSKHPKLAPKKVAPFDEARLTQLDERLARQWLADLGKTVTVDKFFSDEVTLPPPGFAVEVRGNEDLPEYTEPGSSEPVYTGTEMPSFEPGG